MPNMTNLFICLTLLIPSLNSCIVASDRRTVAPRYEVHKSSEHHLQEIQKGAVAISVIERILSIPGVLQQVPLPLLKSLKESSYALRYLARPQLTSDGTQTRMQAFITLPSGVDARVSDLQLSAWFTGNDSSPSVDRLLVTNTSAVPSTDYEIFKRGDASARFINFQQILSLFTPEEALLSEETLFLSGLASYSTDKVGLIDIDGQDLIFRSKGFKSMLTFSVSVDDKTGAIAAGKITGKTFDNGTNDLSSEYEWDVETIVRNARNWPVKDVIAGNPVL